MSVNLHYVYDGDCCGDCCDAMERIAADGTLVDAATAKRLDAAVGQCEWGCNPRESHEFLDADRGPLEPEEIGE